MENLYLVLFVFVVYYPSSNGEDGRYFININRDNSFDEQFEGKINNEKTQNNLHLVGVEKDSNELFRPCALDDWECIRKFFADNSECRPSYGPIPDPLMLERITQYYPFANLTAIQTEFTATGLSSAKFTEFYVNRDNGNLVFAINFKNLNETSPKAFFRYKRTAKESIVLEDFTTILYSSGTLTAVIPKVPNLRLELAEVHADIDNALPPFYIGPNAFSSTDPDVIGALTAFSSDIPTAIREAFLFKSQLYIAIFIQRNICDFGLKIISA